MDENLQFLLGIVIVVVGLFALGFLKPAQRIVLKKESKDGEPSEEE